MKKLKYSPENLVQPVTSTQTANKNRLTGPVNLSSKRFELSYEISARILRLNFDRFLHLRPALQVSAQRRSIGHLCAFRQQGRRERTLGAHTEKRAGIEVSHARTGKAWNRHCRIFTAHLSGMRSCRKINHRACVQIRRESRLRQAGSEQKFGSELQIRRSGSACRTCFQRRATGRALCHLQENTKRRTRPVTLQSLDRAGVGGFAGGGTEQTVNQIDLLSPPNLRTDRPILRTICGARKRQPLCRGMRACIYSDHPSHSCFANNKTSPNYVGCPTKMEKLSNFWKSEVRSSDFKGINKESELRSRRKSLEQASLTIDHNLVENPPPRGHHNTKMVRFHGTKRIHQALSSAWSRF